MVSVRKKSAQAVPKVRGPKLCYSDILEKDERGGLGREAQMPSRANRGEVIHHYRLQLLLGSQSKDGEFARVEPEAFDGSQIGVPDPD